MKLSIVIPAYNEEKRIRRTLEHYHRYFTQLSNNDTLNYEFVVVLNGCKDNTRSIVDDIQATWGKTVILDLAASGKGLAIIEGFKNAVSRPNDLIGFVDADMATAPEYFYDLVQKIDTNDGIIASRYLKNSIVTPKRPFIKTWGRKLFYNSLVRALFGLKFHDYQCGAKLFKRNVIEQITPLLTVGQWAFDVELLYLCKKFNFSLKEIPTVWHDQADSKLNVLAGGLPMLTALIKLRRQHSNLK